MKVSKIFMASVCMCMTVELMFAQSIDDFKMKEPVAITQNVIRSEFQFNGYTNYWHDIYREWIRYGNLFKVALPNIEYTIAQSKVDVAEDLGVPGLSLSEGFFNGLLSEAYVSLDQPSLSQIEEAVKRSNVLIFTDSNSDTGKKLTADLLRTKALNDKLKSHQFDAEDFVKVDAFILENGSRKLFVVASIDPEMRNRVMKLINDTKDVLRDYDLHKGWFGAKTLVKSVTCTPGHYLDVIGRGMNEGNDWFVFDGYMDFLAKKELETWVDKANIPIVTDVGTSPIYGCKDYDGLQVQGNYTNETWVNYAHSKDGYVFKYVSDTAGVHLKYDGYIAIDSRSMLGGSGAVSSEGNKEQIDSEDVPFISPTTSLENDAVPSSVLFIKKNETLTRQRMWDAIMNRRQVAVVENGKMMGPAVYRHALGLLFLDRIFLEEYFGDKINIEAFMADYKLNIVLTNGYSHEISGELQLVLPQELESARPSSVHVNIPANSSTELTFEVKPLATAMGNVNPVTIHYQWGSNKKSTVASLDLPRCISVHQLLYGLAPKVAYPVTIHNFSEQSSFPVKVEVLDKNNPKKVVYSATQVCATKTGTFRDLLFDLKIPAGGYNVKVTALGVENISQLGVGKATGTSVLSEIDMNDDGIPEYRMENDSVSVSLLATGARVIEYIVKSRNDNVLFKSWPEKAVDDRRPFRKRAYYPYGGFEDFLGQGSMETHKLYDVEIIKSQGDYVQVKMTADYFGNKLEKIFTLYGNSPLLEIKFALKFKNPEANVIGPQPILELGTRHWTEDVFTVPEKDGMLEFVMTPDRTYGRVLYLTEGWNAGYDTSEDVAFVGAFPVTEPLFLHMWMNHPRNRDAQHYYVEFQPWTPIYQKSTMYFSYYIWGAGGSWQNGVSALRDRNLVSKRDW